MHSPKEPTPPSQPDSNIEELLRGQAWRSLTPNIYVPGHDLLPRELDGPKVGSLIDVISGDSGLSAFVQGNSVDSVSSQIPQSLTIADVGRLSFVGAGEAKLCYRLEHDGKKMAVILGGYDESLGAQIPADSKLTKIARNPTQTLFEYSDLRTYAVIPLGGVRALKLQEFGETSESASTSSFGLRTLKAIGARRSAQHYITRTLPQAVTAAGSLTRAELQKPQHYLTKPGTGTVAIIDIPVVVQTG